MTSLVSLRGGLSALLAGTTAYDCVESCIALITPAGKICYMNPAAARLERALHLQDAGEPGILSTPAVMQLLETAIHQETEQRLHGTFYYSRNIPVSLTICLRPVIDTDRGTVDGALVSIGEESIEFGQRHLARSQADKTEMVAQTRRLSATRIENERMIRLLLSEMPIALVVFDRERRVVQLNRAAEKLFDTPRRNAIGLRCSRYLDCFEQSGGSCPVIDQQRRCDLEETVPLTRPDGPQLLRTAVAMQEGDHALVLEAFIDVTDRKHAEERLARYRLELEDIVSERTARLERTVSELESFSYSVSHDLRSPLRAIDGFSQALLDDYGHVLDATATDYVNRSRKAAQRMGNLIDDLLQLSQISRRIIQRRSVDVSAMAEEIAADLETSAPERHVEIVIQPDLCSYAEPGLVHALLCNLIGNAWKFTSSRSDARIEIGRNIVDGEDVFYISDNGIGFNMKYADRLFLPFHVLDAQCAETGNGIGLATVQRIIHRHDGSIWARSAPGEGATFYFTLQP